MTQTGAVFLDAYRSLNAKKMFWVVLSISALAVVMFAFVGIDAEGFKIAIWHFDSNVFNTENVEPAVFYKFIFAEYGVSLWLTWLATILALVSTAGIFPDLINSGSITMLISKPIGRLRLFVLQYLAGLLFVTLQVTVFSLASFLVIGLRGGAWEPGLFMAVPLVVCFFSYLFAACVLVGVATRSTLAALLLTLLFWFFVFAVGTAENTLLLFRTMNEEGVSLQEMQTPPPESGEEPGARAEPSSRPPEPKPEGEKADDDEEAEQAEPSPDERKKP
jgi:ABC-type transport system involved in multi-copper enzyme maturation permease subunit